MAFYLTYILTFCLAFYLAVYLTYILTFCLAFYLAFSVAFVRVQAWPTASGAGRGGEEKEEDEGVAPLLKSRDPQLAGGKT